MVGQVPIMVPDHIIYQRFHCTQGWVRLYDIVLFLDEDRPSGWYYCHGTDNNTDCEYLFTFSTLGQNDRTFLFHDQKKHQTSISVIRYPILTQLIESHVCKPNDIVYNNSNQPLTFEDVPSLENTILALYEDRKSVVEC